VMVLGLWWRRVRAAGQLPKPPAQRHLTDFVGIVAAGVLANALVCATLASSLDRFQARVVWLLPFLALCVLAMSRRAHSSRARFAAASPLSSPADFSLKGAPP
jgi:apolipoprotein N-acyltransferase